MVNAPLSDPEIPRVDNCLQFIRPVRVIIYPLQDALHILVMAGFFLGSAAEIAAHLRGPSFDQLAHP